MYLDFFQIAKNKFVENEMTPRVNNLYLPSINAHVQPKNGKVAKKKT